MHLGALAVVILLRLNIALLVAKTVSFKERDSVFVEPKVYRADKAVFAKKVGDVIGQSLGPEAAFKSKVGAGHAEIVRVLVQKGKRGLRPAPVQIDPPVAHPVNRADGTPALSHLGLGGKIGVDINGRHRIREIALKHGLSVSKVSLNEREHALEPRKILTLAQKLHIRLGYIPGGVIGAYEVRIRYRVISLVLN